MQLGTFEPTSNSTTVLPYRHAGPRRSAISNPNRTPSLNLDLLTLGSVHADGLPWTISLPILVINSSSCFLSAARTNKQTPTNRRTSLKAILAPRLQPTADKKGKGSPYSITKRKVPELIPVLGSQPAGDVSHKPGGRLPLLSARPAVTLATLKRAATNFTAW